MSHLGFRYGTKPAVKKVNSADESRTALAAVALQDHLVKSLSLGDPFKLKKLPGASKPRPKKDARPVIDTGRGRNVAKKKSEPVEQEYVLDPKPAQPTLAQRMGLVEGPPSVLTEQEWRHAKERSNQRDDSSQPCVICKDDFGNQEQVLLSCTHVFHRACLQAFERFTGRKTCPMCRKQQYQTRIIHEGAAHYRHKCATRIQATWRGYVVHSWYRKLRETVPPNDPMLKKKFYENKLVNITDRMVRSCNYDIDSFLAEMDRNIEASRDVFRHLEDASRTISEEDWEGIQLKAVTRGDLDCPICLTALEKQGLVSKSAKAREETKKGASKATGAKGATKKTVKTEKKKIVSEKKRMLLSCSHVFHQACLEAFEEFSEGDSRHVCPVCRTMYQKQIL